MHVHNVDLSKRAPSLQFHSSILCLYAQVVLLISHHSPLQFPYAVKALRPTATAKWDDKEFKTYVSQFPLEAQTSPEALIEHVEDLTKKDVKIAYLKNLQGYLWKEGFESGEFASPLFQDVAPTLREWHREGIKLAIYSSGSIAAQHLFMQFVQKVDASGRKTRSSIDLTDSATTEDLRPLMSGYYDTVNAGSKMDKESYVKICGQLGVGGFDPHSIVFFTDNVKGQAVPSITRPMLIVHRGRSGRRGRIDSGSDRATRQSRTDKGAGERVVKQDGHQAVASRVPESCDETVADGAAQDQWPKLCGPRGEIPCSHVVVAARRRITVTRAKWDCSPDRMTHVNGHARLRVNRGCRRREEHRARPTISESTGVVGTCQKAGERADQTFSQACPPSVEAERRRDCAIPRQRRAKPNQLGVSTLRTKSRGSRESIAAATTSEICGCFIVASAKVCDWTESC
ncbi:hypothetical protein MRB53_039627 [Persea americana]|nr:hypothetical protein MRB53_039627 [Persea americana]